MPPYVLRQSAAREAVTVVPPALRSPPEVPIENRLAWSYEDLALMTGLSVPTLRSLVTRQGFPHVRVGHRVLFTPDSVRDWFAAQVVTVPTGSEPLDHFQADGDAEE